ncbi:hypothetical protein G6F66_013965 [Rhizopus arrhizus]|nr:hypothetical protein G6F66_013965 [Rhizopus arrhizus]
MPCRASGLVAACGAADLLGGGRHAGRDTLLRTRHSLPGHDPHRRPAHALADAEHHDARQQRPVAGAMRHRQRHRGDADGTGGESPGQHLPWRTAPQHAFGNTDAEGAHQCRQQEGHPGLQRAPAIAVLEIQRQEVVLHAIAAHEGEGQAECRAQARQAQQRKLHQRVSAAPFDLYQHRQQYG